MSLARDFSRTRLTLDQAMTFAGISWVPGATPNITFDPHVARQYRIILSHRHDGTLVFSRQLMQEALLRMIQQTTYYKPDGPPDPGWSIRYVVGWVRIARIFGLVDLPCGRFPGERESVTIPVRCEYFKELQ